NALDKYKAENSEQEAALAETLLVLTKLLAPIAPHAAHVLWHAMGQSGEVINASWPVLDESALVQDTLTLVVQVNGKKREEISVSADASKDQIEAIALASPGVVRHLDGQPAKKVIVVPGRLVNIVA
ncbi:MAG: class I tRNA ligase family protein, partial [Methylococcales bacterium]|nr:class I tRNA ligase family protein [Methylococcales bacterium]